MEEALLRCCAIGFSFLLATIPAACGAQPKVAIRTQQGREVTFQVEVAATPNARELGLQYRRELTEDRGMLFIFPEQRENAFWMKNTPIPLDMLFIDQQRKIVGIVYDAVPFSLDSRSVPAASQYVLEINGGLSRRYGLTIGDVVRFENVPESVRE
jgi:uncharacterized protein